MTGRARTVFLGSGPFGVPTLRRLAGLAQAELVGLVTAPPRPAGRAGRPRPTPIDTVANELGIEQVLRPERLRSAEAVEAVLRLEPDLAVLADYGQMVPPPLLELPRGALNLHPSLLPRHRGASPIPATILAGDRETGVSLMQMDAGLDSGPLLAQRRLALAGDETAPDLEATLSSLAAELLAEALPEWLAGRLAARAQPAEGISLTRPLRRADGRLDPARAAPELERQVRAYQPWPGSFVETPLGRLVIWRARALPAEESIPAGMLVAPPGDGGLAIATRDGLLDILEAQPAGGRRLPVRELVRGRPGLVGSRVG